MWINLAEDDLDFLDGALASLADAEAIQNVPNGPARRLREELKRKRDEYNSPKANYLRENVDKWHRLDDEMEVDGGAATSIADDGGWVQAWLWVPFPDPEDDDEEDEDDSSCDPAWQEDPEYPMLDWQYEIANGDTRLGYSAWVESRKAADAEGP